MSPASCETLSKQPDLLELQVPFIKHRSEFSLNRIFVKIHQDACSLPHQYLLLFRNPSAIAKPVLIEWELDIPPLENQEDSTAARGLRILNKNKQKTPRNKENVLYQNREKGG